MNTSFTRFYEAGYQDGFAHGRIHGLIEGRAFGQEKGYEMWEEIGFYEGFALLWKAIHGLRGRPDELRFSCLLLSRFPSLLCSNAT